MYGMNIKFLRKKFKMNQTELANKLNLTRDMIASLEIERAKPSLDTIMLLSNFFNVKIDDLIYKDLEKEE